MPRTPAAPAPEPTAATGPRLAEIGWRRTGERFGFSLTAVGAAFVGGFFLVPFVVFTVFNGWDFWPGGIVWTFLLLNPVAIPLGISLRLARRSGISLVWLMWPLLGTIAAGSVGFAAWFASVWEPMD